MCRVMEEALEEEKKYSYDAGVQYGIEQGIERGIEQGQLASRLVTARNLLKMGLPIEMIIKGTGITREQLAGLMSEA